MGHELLIIALNGDSVVILNHQGKPLALTPPMCSAAGVCKGSMYVSFVCILELLEAGSHIKGCSSLAIILENTINSLTERRKWKNI